MSKRSSFWSSQSVNPPTGRKHLWALSVGEIGGGRVAAVLDLLRGGRRIEERDDAVRRHAEEREAAVGRRSAREEPAEVHDLRVVREGAAVFVGDGVVGRRPRHGPLGGRIGGSFELTLPIVPVVRRPKKTHGGASRKSHAVRERNVRAHLGLNAYVGGRAAEDAARHLQGVADVNSLVGLDRVVTEVEMGDELGKRQVNGLECGVERADIGEGVLDLERVVEGHDEALPERSVDADRDLDFAVSDDRGDRRRIHLDEQREDVEFRANERVGAGFDEARLLELQLEPLLGERADFPSQLSIRYG